MLDMTTKYLGMTLKNPIVASASPLCESLDNVRRMEDAGGAAVVLHSLFEEQITLQSMDLDRYLSRGTESFAESLSFFPNMEMYNLGPDGYLEHIRNLKSAVEIPIIASLNGYSTGGWIKYAKMIEDAGADALELNIYYVASDPRMQGKEVEAMYLDLVHNVKSSISIPIAIKLGPDFTALANMASKLEKAGADGLVMFNRFYQPDFDLESLEVTPNLNLSSPAELLHRLRWVAILFDQVDIDLAVTGGVHGYEGVIKSMMAGADVAMMTSALLQKGIGYISQVYVDMVTWMEEHEYESIKQMQGSMSQRAVIDPATFERANYMRVLRSYAMSEF
jgi:dihydroorotate dehydrogenase (fumarate)